MEIFFNRVHAGAVPSPRAKTPFSREYISGTVKAGQVGKHGELEEIVRIRL
jgi:hypothetical protein